jgi:hypothetical protein
LPRHQRDDVAARRADGEADADLTAPLGDHEGEHAIRPDDGQQQREAAQAQ